MKANNSFSNDLVNLTGMEPAALICFIFALSSISIPLITYPRVPTDVALFLVSMGVVGLCVGMYGVSRLLGLGGLVGAIANKKLFWFSFIPMQLAASMLVSSIATL